MPLSDGDFKSSSFYNLCKTNVPSTLILTARTKLLDKCANSLIADFFNFKIFVKLCYSSKAIFAFFTSFKIEDKL